MIPGERRAHPRRPVRLEAGFAWRRVGLFGARCGEGRGLAENLSEGGALLRLPSPLPPGAHLQLCLRDPSSGRVAYLDARLVWEKPAADGEGFIVGARFTTVAASAGDLARLVSPPA